MYAPHGHLGSFSSFLKKTRKVLHNLSPRELSLTRMADKYQKDQAKKSQAKMAKQQAAGNAELLALAQERLKQVSPTPAALSFNSPSAGGSGASPSPSQSASDDGSSAGMLALVGLGLVGALYVIRKRRK
jgi:hypothetical protein